MTQSAPGMSVKVLNRQNGGRVLLRRLAWFVDHVMYPSLALLHAEAPPLLFGHEVRSGHQFGQLLR